MPILDHMAEALASTVADGRNPTEFLLGQAGYHAMMADHTAQTRDNVHGDELTVVTGKRVHGVPWRIALGFQDGFVLQSE